MCTSEAARSSRLHAARVGADAIVEGAADVDQVGQLREALLDVGLAQPVEATLEAQQLPTGLLGIERGLLEGGADAQADLLGLVDHVVAGDGGPAA